MNNEEQRFLKLLRAELNKHKAKNTLLPVYVDYDDVMVDLLKPLIEMLNEITLRSTTYAEREIYGLKHSHPSRCVKFEDVREWDHLGNVFSHGLVDRAFVSLIPYLPEKGNAFAAFKELREIPLLNAKILTAVNGDDRTERRRNHIKQNLPFLPADAVICDPDKSKYSGGLLIDDGAHNIRNYDGLKILINMPHNEGMSISPRTIRMNTLEDAVVIIRKAFYEEKSI